MRLRRATRESYRRELAAVRLELGTPSAAAVRADIAANQARAARLRPCRYCDTAGGHTADCSVIS